MSIVLSWLLWGVALILQNASFTWVSRARNSDNLKEHVKASFFSNGTYFLNLFIGVNQINNAKGDFGLMIFTILFYTAFTMSGSIYTHHLLLKRKRNKGIS